MTSIHEVSDTIEEKATVWIRAEPGMATVLRHEFRKFLSTPDIREKLAIFRRRIVRFFLNIFTRIKSIALT